MKFIITVVISGVVILGVWALLVDKKPSADILELNIIGLWDRPYTTEDEAKIMIESCNDKGFDTAIIVNEDMFGCGNQSDKIFK